MRSPSLMGGFTNMIHIIGLCLSIYAYQSQVSSRGTTQTIRRHRPCYRTIIAGMCSVVVELHRIVLCCCWNNACKQHGKEKNNYRKRNDFVYAHECLASS
jgi:hypothetical protein